jgi:hypothetical protein
MNCREVETIIADMARGVDAGEGALAHVMECRSCSELLAGEEELTAGLRAWAEASKGEQAPCGVEEKLLEAFRRRTAAAPRGRGRLLVVAVGSIAAALVLLVKLYTPARPVATHVAQPPAVAPVRAVSVEAAPVAPRNAKIRPARRAVRAVADAQPVEAEVDFLPVAQGDGWTPLDGGRLVRVELPRSALRVFGLPMNEERAQERIQADVMLSNDGLLRAIRLVK